MQDEVRQCVRNAQADTGVWIARQIVIHHRIHVVTLGWSEPLAPWRNEE